ncbi:MAG: hypothetical protein AB8F74_04850 [Saprospiraceae bacterium]
MKRNKHYQIDKSDGKRYILWSAILCTLLILFFRWENNSILERSLFLKENGLQSIATITNLKGRTRCAYRARGTTFEIVVRTPFDRLLNGETYHMVYNKDSPKDALVFFDKPFIQDSSTFAIVPLLSGHLKIYSNTKYYFTYEVAGIEHERVQLIDPSKRIPSKVFYLESNPGISYLFYEDE